MPGVRHEFASSDAVAIGAGAPAQTRSTIAVSGVGDARIVRLGIRVELEHAWRGDLALSLLSPNGTRVVLARRRGGRAGDFAETVFDADAPLAIADAIAPFAGRVRPLGDLRDLHGCCADGDWALEADDRDFHDAGAIRGWSLQLETAAAEERAFVIDVRFRGGLTSAQQAAFETAATRWARIVAGDLPSVIVDGETVDDVVIDASGAAIDGPLGILGRAGPTQLRPGSFLPAAGVMEFDSADLLTMEGDGSLVSVITHEMGHVLGFGTIWDELALRQGAGTVNPTFTGANAMREFATLSGAAATRAVPLANVGGPGTRDGHWREAVFGNELMTGLLDDGPTPLGRLTIAAFEDMGYEVRYDAADPYALPTALELTISGAGLAQADHGGRGIMLVPPRTILPDAALL
jgi:subtilisin-like proprotein convertase family protein